ncbi:hypothetical protein NDU88_005861 [Pleurodeles waltl]|uniref:Uncharacterized protein n=1 Tax=Pleurodeles waltl TaxID=8319 RepID=A0AAV7PKS2_PLEWA|nr:hypothetical protein NDU88_005861 [Pleurodeles waltl]
MVTPPPGQNRRRGRGNGRRGGDKNRMTEKESTKVAVTGFNIADSSQLMVISDLANESNEVGCSIHDDTNIRTSTLNEMGFLTNLHDNSHLKLSSRFNPPLPSGNLIDTFHELVISDIDKFRIKGPSNIENSK